MNPEDHQRPLRLEKTPSHEYASSGSESRKPSSSSGKKRASRAGTRSVTTLSAAQLERKRANDREAQRAIRQRTKDHIDGLEKSIGELRVAQDASEKLVAATQRRNKELEDENAYLRSRLGDATFTLNVGQTEGQPSSDVALLSASTTSPSAQQPLGTTIHRPSSASTKRSLSVTTSQSSNSRHGSWQHQGNFGGPPVPTVGPSANAPGNVANISNWRSHENAPIQPLPARDGSDLVQHQQQTTFPTPAAAERPSWASTSGTYPYSLGQEQQRPPQYQPPPQQQQYTHAAPVTQYQQQPTYQSAAATPHAEFQGLSVTGTSPYQVPTPGAFQTQPQYHMQAMQQVSPGSDYPAQGQMPAPQLTPSAYQPPPGNPQYPPQPPPQGQQIPIQYREDPAGRPYQYQQYPPNG